MTVRQVQLSVGSEIEVLWTVDGDAVWWGACVEAISRSPSSHTQPATIAYEAKFGHSVTRSEVLIRDDLLIEGDTEMRWRRKGEHRVMVPGADLDGRAEDVAEDGHGQDGDGNEVDFIDDPSKSASDVIRMALAQAIDSRSTEEQRLLAAKVSDALAAFQHEVQTTLQALGSDDEVDDRVAQGIISRMASKMRDPDTMSEAGSDLSM